MNLLLNAFNLPPEKAVEYLKAKGYTFSWDWHDTWQEAHAKAFTVAKAMKLDILKDIREIVEKSLQEGLTLNQFRKELEPRLKAKGWWGVVKAKDAPGYDPASGGDPQKIVQLGSPYRLRTIYRTNMHVAQMAGRYKGMMAAVKSRPYWQYIAVMDGRTRPSHRKLHGKVYRYDHPFWNIWYPPNGWFCRCRVRSLSAADLKRLNLKVETAMPADLPDEGWRYHPGKHALWDENAALPDCMDMAEFAERQNIRCVRIVPGQKNWKDFARPDVRELEPHHFHDVPILPAAKNFKNAKKLLAGALGVSKEKPIRFIVSPIEKVLINYNFLHHLVEKREDKRERYANFIIDTITNPFEIYITQYDDSWRRTYIGLFKGKHNLLVVIRINKDSSMLWNIMHTDNKGINKKRIGDLIWVRE